MKEASFSGVLFLVVLLLLLPGMVRSDETPDIPVGVHTYQESVGENKLEFFWQAESKEEFVTISVYEQNKSFKNICTSDGKTRQWHLKEDGKYDIHAERNGNILHISGFRNGEPYNKKIKIDDRPWFQPLSFSLRDFLRSNEQSVSFWTVRADTIEPIALKATKKGDEQIVCNGITHTAEKVEVRAEGFYSSFWHGSYWYDKKDALFLKYSSVHGLPGSDETIVELIKKPK